MSNLSKERRDKMIAALDDLKKGVSEEQQKIILGIKNELVNKKYGLVWEEHQEKVDLELERKIPVFKEDANKKIISDKKNSYNFLLEGDNLHSLYLLEKTHKAKIDIIYIDPPYNTKNKEFIYNDEMIGEDDEFRHSKWLSFISKRLTVSRSLLCDSGVIFISIDNNEYAQLKMLCDEIFGEKNFITSISRLAIKGGSRANNIKTVNDYVLVYSKNVEKLTEFTGVEKDALVFNEMDENGPYIKGRELNKWGAGSRREDSPSMYYPIMSPSGEEVYPIRNDGSEGRWRWGKKKMMEAIKENNVIFEKRDNGTYIVYEKVRSRKTNTKQFTSWFDDNYINAKGSQALKKVFNTMMSVFDYAKPIELVKDLVFMANNKEAVVLDFFAGSGTTAHAVLDLNREDGGNRKFILCTNNENKICEEITYPRIKTVITGYRGDNSVYDEPICANLKYYKTEWIDRESQYLEDELTMRIFEMIELENHIEIDNEKYVVIMSEGDAQRYLEDTKTPEKIKKVWYREDVLFTSNQLKNLKNVDTKAIPRNYFDVELKEGGYYD
ncbi:site-specific DNA-methyltransferase [Erysipelothrix rhusiopathiae]|uniref:site-specific DNA-methyltransferase n=1 Tax=Erysipelothrix rhusiopathiae TaxID=1648 RepID=UPI0024818D23|nr:site-specific DNA-methyltransferase [Erysipelothrix rhusiopathiae]